MKTLGSSLNCYLHYSMHYCMTDHLAQAALRLNLVICRVTVHSPSPLSPPLYRMDARA